MTVGIGGSGTVEVPVGITGSASGLGAVTGGVIGEVTPGSGSGSMVTGGNVGG